MTIRIDKYMEIYGLFNSLLGTPTGNKTTSTISVSTITSTCGLHHNKAFSCLHLCFIINHL